jgi:hypothetical protein
LIRGLLRNESDLLTRSKFTISADCVNGSVGQAFPLPIVLGMAKAARGPNLPHIDTLRRTQPVREPTVSISLCQGLIVPTQNITTGLHLTRRSQDIGSIKSTGLARGQTVLNE